jgi:molybdopterin synthase catalytic subunit
MVTTEITTAKIEQLGERQERRETGAELIFFGRVRDDEAGQSISGLEYEHYAGMAEKELQKLAEETVAKYPIQEIDCRHRVGFVPVGEASLRLSIFSAHRREALDAMDWFINQLKERVPVWKWGVTVNGEKFPSK